MRKIHSYKSKELGSGSGNENYKEKGNLENMCKTFQQGELEAENRMENVHFHSSVVDPDFLFGRNLRSAF